LQISYWIATQIVTQVNLKDRISVLKKIILVAEACESFRNYNSAMAILCGLNLSAVNRLRKTWKGVPKKYKEIFDRLNVTLSSDSNYKQYRELMVSQQPPMSPYLGVFLKDIILIEIGNPTYLGDSNTLVNFSKFRMISNIIAEITTLQRVHYTFPINNDLYNIFQSPLLVYNEEKLFDLSREVEPASQKTNSSSSIVSRFSRGNK
jgi:hypothetical protein